MNRLSFAGLMIVAAPVGAYAQITFDASVLEQLVGNRIDVAIRQINTQHYPALSTMIDATGGGQTYDFSAFTSTLSGVSYDLTASASGTPGAMDSDFGTANYVQHQNVGGTSYVYSDLNDSGLYVRGSIFVQATDIDGNGVLDESISKIEPPDREYAFPLTENSTWSQQYVTTTTGFGLTSQSTTTIVNTVDSWGTLVTPDGSAPTLRIKRSLTSESSGQSYSTTTYLFVTDALLGASIILDEQGNVLSASVNKTSTGAPSSAESVPTGLAGFGLHHNYPNPFALTSTVSFELDESSEVSLNMFDILGREVANIASGMFAPGVYHQTVTSAGLADGVYFLRLETDGRASVRTVVINRLAG